MIIINTFDDIKELDRQQLVPQVLLEELKEYFKGLVKNLTGECIWETYSIEEDGSIYILDNTDNPRDLEEAASVDGANKLQSLRLVMLPLLLPGIVATAVFTFIYTWNEFLLALMLTNQQSKFTLPVGLSFMMGEFNVNYGALAAGSVIALVPAVILFAYAQKHLVNGMGGAVKG